MRKHSSCILHELRKLRVMELLRNGWCNASVSGRFLPPVFVDYPRHAITHELELFLGLLVFSIVVLNISCSVEP